MKTKTYTPSASFINLLMDPVFAVDANACVVFVSAACERIFGYTPQEMIGKNMFDMMVPEDRDRTRESVHDVMSGRPQLHFENRYRRKDGQVIHIMWATHWSPADQLRIGVARDITERKRQETMQAALYAISEAAHATEDLPALLDHIHQIVGTLLPVHNFSVVLYDEQTDQQNLAYHVDEHEITLTTDPLCTEIIRSGQPLLLTSDMIAARNERTPIAADITPLCWLGVPLKSQKGTIGVLVVKSYPGGVEYSEKDQELLQFVSTQIATAVERQRMQVRLQHMAQYDQLTGLPNRGLLHDRLTSALATARRDRVQFSLLYLDLDKFKEVNDTLGHSAGDLLLQEVATRLEQCVRESDTVARIGGDEFVVLLLGIREQPQGALVAEKIRAALSLPFTFDNHDLHIVPSIGIAHYPEHGDSGEQLLRYADHDMYSTKKGRKSGVPDGSPPAPSPPTAGT